jgi:hypothetical protein
MSVGSQFVGLAMNMSVRTETSLVLNARPDTRGIKVSRYSSFLLFLLLASHGNPTLHKGYTAPMMVTFL